MSKAPTLIDFLYRLSFKNRKIGNWQSNAGMRERLQAARRFMLDDNMSSFLADLAMGSLLKVKLDKRAQTMEQLRVSARLPYPVMWIEAPLRSYLQRCNELGALGVSEVNIKPEDAPQTEGWLLERHPQIDTAVRMHLFLHDDKLDELGNDVFTFPWCYAWNTDDNPLPWTWVIDPASEPSVDIPGKRFSPSELYTGAWGYHTNHIQVVATDLLYAPRADVQQKALNLIHEWMGCVRRVWTLLATIDDIPMIKGDVRASKGFVAKGRYRRFLDHQTVTLNVPQQRHGKLATKVLALARRRAHDVKGHWRIDWRHPGNRSCALDATRIGMLPHHAWQVDQACSCGAHRIWVREHQRGDATLGYVTHDYKVTHDNEPDHAQA